MNSQYDYETLLRSMQNQMVLAQNFPPRQSQHSSRPNSSRPLRHARIEKPLSNRNSPQHSQRRRPTPVLRNSASCNSIKSSRKIGSRSLHNPERRVAGQRHVDSTTFNSGRPFSWHPGISAAAVPQQRPAMNNMAPGYGYRTDQATSNPPDSMGSSSTGPFYHQQENPTEGGLTGYIDPQVMNAWMAQRDQLLSPPPTGTFPPVPNMFTEYPILDPNIAYPVDPQMDLENFDEQEPVNRFDEGDGSNFRTLENYERARCPLYDVKTLPDIPKAEIKDEFPGEELVGMGLYDKPDVKPNHSMLLSSALSGHDEPSPMENRDLKLANAFDPPPEQVPDAIADEGDDTPVANQYNPWFIVPDAPPHFGGPPMQDLQPYQPFGVTAVTEGGDNHSSQDWYNGVYPKHPDCEDPFDPANAALYPWNFPHLGYEGFF